MCYWSYIGAWQELRSYHQPLRSCQYHLYHAMSCWSLWTILNQEYSLVLLWVCLLYLPLLGQHSTLIRTIWWCYHPCVELPQGTYHRVRIIQYGILIFLCWKVTTTLGVWWMVPSITFLCCKSWGSIFFGCNWLLVFMFLRYGGNMMCWKFLNLVLVTRAFYERIKPND